VFEFVVGFGISEDAPITIIIIIIIITIVWHMGWKPLLLFSPPFIIPHPGSGWVVP